MEFSESRLADRLVLGAIAHRISNDDGEAFPSIKTIGREANVSERQVYDSISTLTLMGELMVREEASKLGTNTYFMPKFFDWYDSLHPAKSAPPPPAKHAAAGVQSVQNTPAQIADEPSVIQPSEKQPSDKPCRSCGEVGVHHCKGDPNRKRARVPRHRRGNRSSLSVVRPAAIYHSKFDVQFGQFWESYPNKENPVRARNTWDELVRDESTATLVLVGMMTWKESARWKEGYIPTASNFLKEERWKEEPPTNGAHQQSKTAQRNERSKAAIAAEFRRATGDSRVVGEVRHSLPIGN